MATTAAQSPPHTTSGVQAPLLWQLALGAHLVALAYGAVENELLAASATASLALFALTWYSFRHRALAAFSLVLSCICGNVTVFAYANLAYVELTDLPTGQHHEVTAWLTGLLCWCAVVSAVCTHLWLGTEALSLRTELLRKWQTLALACVVFAVLAVIFVVGGEFDGRWNAPTSSAMQYYANGVRSIAYVLFFLLGTWMNGRLLAPRNVAILSVVGALAIAQGFSGGREYSILMFGFLLLGASSGSMPRRTLLALAGILFAFAVIFVAVVGHARGNQHFAFGTVDDRMYSIGQAAHQSLVDDSSPVGPVPEFAQRLFEMSAQVVIDQTFVTQRFAGFEHVERLKYLFVPLALAPEKETVDDGREILIRDYGYDLGDTTTVPLPLVADTYRRGGLLWIVVVGLCIGIWLRLLVRLTRLVAGRELAAIVLAMLSISYFRSYPYGVFAIISAFTYAWLKEVALVVGFFWLARFLVIATEERSIARAH